MKKKLIPMVLSAATIATTLAPSATVFANQANIGTDNVEVVYDTSKSIPDPDNPGAPTYQVIIPSVIEFKGNGIAVEANVSIKEGNDKTKDYTGTETIKVNVESENEFNVKCGNEELAYDLSYGDTTLTSGTAGVTEITALSKDKVEEKGTAILREAATKSGTYTDTLIYSVQKADSTITR